MAYRHPGTIHYDNLPEPTGGTFNAQAFARGHRRWAFVPPAAGDPAQTGTIDDAAVLTHIGNIEWLDEIEYGNLDLENPYLANLADGVTAVLDGESLSNVATYQSSMAEMVDLIDKVRDEYPQIKWSFYSIPNVRFFIANNTWHGLETQGDTATIEARLDAYLAAYGPLMDAQDYVSPQILDRYVAPERDQQSRRFVHYSMEACNRWMADRGRTVDIVANGGIQYQYTDNFDGYIPTFIPTQELADEQIKPTLDNGGRTLLLWTGLTSFVPWAFDLSTFPLDHTQAGDAQAQLRAYRVNRYRLAFTADFFDGVAPDWNSADDQETLRRALCEKMLETMDAMQSTVRLYGAAKASTLTALA